MNVERRLAAILAADMAGYSRRMEANEAGTLAALKERRRASEENDRRESRIGRGGHQIPLQVGINLGDVVVEDGDLYGDCINIASRLAALA
jgi:adenylate cyclase